LSDPGAVVFGGRNLLVGESLPGGTVLVVGRLGGEDEMTLYELNPSGHPSASADHALAEASKV
jgi:hypothetical protein